jgi:branched-chain amino acid transport system permease protein
METHVSKLKSGWRTRSKSFIAIAVLGLILLIMPHFVSSYTQNIMSKILIFGLFALSLNFLWGYSGLFSLGHAAYFGIAGYTVGILIVRYGVDNFWLDAPFGILAATICAAIFGIAALRMAKAYFLLITLALGQLTFSLAEKWTNLTGGTNGLVGITAPNMHLGFTMNILDLYYLIFVIFIICAIIIYRIIKSPFGSALKGIRENELRMRALGYNTWLFKYITFILAGLFAGVAGVLFAYYNGIMSPTHVGVETSTMPMLMVIIGSSSLVFGPVLGAMVVVILEQVISAFIPERWPLVLGSIFVLSVIFLRGGLSIQLLNIWRIIAGRGSSSS